MNDTQMRNESVEQDPAYDPQLPQQYGPEVSLEERLRRVHEQMLRG